MNQEHPSTYFIQNRVNSDELKRLEEQDKLLNTMIGRVLPEPIEPSLFKRVLDVACGTGGWLVETAQNYPSIQRLVGVDVSTRTINHAKEYAERQQVSDRVQFLMMDALRMLEFPVHFFDLVHHRLASSFLRVWDWPKLLQEYGRVCRVGGTIAVTECDIVETNSPALTELTMLFRTAFYKAGHFGTPQNDGLTPQLKSFFTRADIKNVQEYVHSLHFLPDTPEKIMIVNDITQSFRLIQPFLHHWTQVPEDYDKMLQKALEDMNQPDFEATWKLVTVSGQNHS